MYEKIEIPAESKDKMGTNLRLQDWLDKIGVKTDYANVITKEYGYDEEKIQQLNSEEIKDMIKKVGCKKFSSHKIMTKLKIKTKLKTATTLDKDKEEKSISKRLKEWLVDVKGKTLGTIL
eukprot:TRINITY_DN2502_c0_g1_i1.p1 TRINITY_DN2502_c0_g1~~TRINITY_DN2502_c0_g1_i1.p1  ORF type:complete len:120 (-),score=21.38 TRINITY_DN2502_c0_g1_i1:209-568(-)